MSKRWCIIGCKVREALAESSRLIFLFCRGENWGLERGSPSSHLSSRTLREPGMAPCAQMGVFGCKCTLFSKSPIPTGPLACKELPSLACEKRWAEWSFQGILNAAWQSSYWYFQRLVEHPRSKSCTRPDCSPQGQCGHINFQPMQWLEGWSCPWWSSRVPGFSSLFQMPLGHFMAHWLCPPRGWGGEGRASEWLIKHWY